MKFDVLLFLTGVAGVTLGVALAGTDAGVWLFVSGCLAMILAPVATATSRRQ